MSTAASLRPPLIGAVISLTACNSDTCSDQGPPFDCCTPPGWELVREGNGAHIALPGNGEDRLTCQSRQASSRRRDHSAASRRASRETSSLLRQTSCLPASHASKESAWRSSLRLRRDVSCTSPSPPLAAKHSLPLGSHASLRFVK